MAGPGAGPARGGGLSFVERLGAAWGVLFPGGGAGGFRGRAPSGREVAKARLRMVLVADRCALSPAAVEEMKAAVVGAMEAFVDVAEEEAVEVNVTQEEALGMVCSVAVPVRKIKAAALERPQVAAEDPGGQGGGDGLEDPADRFPFGT